MDKKDLTNLLAEIDPDVLKNALISAIGGQEDSVKQQEPVVKKRVKKKVKKSKPDFMHKIILSDSERKELEQAKLDDIKNGDVSKKRVTKRTAAVKIDVVCRVCGSRESVYPSAVADASRYKCNNCSVAAG